MKKSEVVADACQQFVQFGKMHREPRNENVLSIINLLNVAQYNFIIDSPVRAYTYLYLVDEVYKIMDLDDNHHLRDGMELVRSILHDKQ